MAAKCERKENKEEKVIRPVSSQLADFPRLAPAPASSEIGCSAVNPESSSGNPGLLCSCSYFAYWRYIDGPAYPFARTPQSQRHPEIERLGDTPTRVRSGNSSLFDQQPMTANG